MNSSEKIEILKSRIEEVLRPLIDRDYVLLELPYYENIGDILIWEGERHFLEKLPYRCLYKASLFSYDSNYVIPTDAIILLQGGGNFGDVWKRSQKFRLQIIEKYAKNRIIIFPQTVFYEDEAVFQEEARRMAEHKQLTICARDQQSFDLLQSRFQNEILLLPDMAFCISIDKLAKYKKREQNKILFLKRKDKEFKETSPGDLPFPVMVTSDWPTYERRFVFNLIMRLSEKVKNVLARMGQSGSCWGKWIDFYADRVYRKKMLKVGVGFVSSYKRVYTTRLHVAILAILLEKECFFLDNSYGKNSGFYHTWLEEMKNVHFVE